MISKMKSIIMLLGLAALVLGVVVTQAGAQSFIYDHNPIPAGAIGFNPDVNYDLPNWSQSPNIRKFVDRLPALGVATCTAGNAGFTNAMCTGVGTPALCCTGAGTGVCQVNNSLCTASGTPSACCTGAGTGTCSPYADSQCGQNNLGQFIPVAQPDTTSYAGSAYYEMNVSNFKVQMHSDLPATALRGYAQTNATDAKINGIQYLGPAIVARVFNPNTAAGAPTSSNPFGVGGNGWPVRLKWQNKLPTTVAGTSCTTPETSAKLCLPVDTTLMGAGMGPQKGSATCDMGTAAANAPCDMFTENRITTPHLHGGRTPWISDGTPNQWVTPSGETAISSVATSGYPFGMAKGPSFVNVPDMINSSTVNGTAVPCIGGSKCFTATATDGIGTSFFSNQQSSRLMFFHDHVYGITRLNVYKGLAAPYLLVDTTEDDAIDGTNASGWGGSAFLPKQAWGASTNLGFAALRYGIPIVIQDKAFVNDVNVNSPTQLAARGFPSAQYIPSAPTYVSGCAPVGSTGHTQLYKTQNPVNATTCGTDPLWERYVGSTGGQLWAAHEYMPVENIYDPTGNTTNGRWDYGPFLIPPAIPKNLTLPSPTITPEAFQDTMVVNGTAFPYVEVPPDIIRLRILTIGNDRTTNLQLYKADPMQIRLTNGGSGYAPPPAAAPLVTVQVPPCTINGTTCVQGTATAQVSNGEITNIIPARACAGFVNPPTVSITPNALDSATANNCGGATISANVMWNSHGQVTGFTGLINSAGAYVCSGYNNPPTITITDSTGGVSCTGTAVIAPAGQIAAVAVASPGAGYITGNPPTVTVAPPTTGTTATAVAFVNTEVKMVDARPNTAYPTWPADGRAGGVPDPTTQGPPWIMIGNEGGLLAQAAIIPQQPIDFEQIRQNIPAQGVTSHSLLLLADQRADVLVDLRSFHPGDTVILYNDAPAPMPSFWPLNDYFTDGPDLRSGGGPGVTAPGFGPNTRTVMQIRIVNFPTGVTASFSGTTAAAYQSLVQANLPKAFATSNDPPIVNQMAYNSAFPTGPYHATADTYVEAPDTTINLTGHGQPIAKIKTTGPGNSYTAAPTVSITPTTTDPAITFVAATATAGLDPAGTITLLTAGSGYASNPTCTISAPAACTATTGCVTATCVAQVTGGIVTALSLDEPGAGYSTATAATCTIGAPTGAGGVAATCSMLVPAANTVGSITITNGGAGYLGEPRIYLLPNNAGAFGATAVALLAGLGGTAPAGSTTLSAPTFGVMTGKSIMEGFDPDYGRLNILMGSTPNPLTPNVGLAQVAGAAFYVDPPSEFLNDGDPIVWRISHLGVDSHALHFHLFDVQVINRVDYTNVVKPPYPDEIGWKDTIRTNPFEDYIVAFKPHTVPLPFPMPRSNRPLDPSTPVGSSTNFLPVAPPAGIATVPQVVNSLTDFGWEYVWHCHMLSHEENDFMRPVVFSGNPPAAVTGLTGTLALSPATVTLNWTGSFPIATSLVIQRSTSSTFATTTTLATLTGTLPVTYADTTIGSVTGVTTVYYRVQATNLWGSSAWTTVTVNLLQPAPTGLTAALTNSTTLTLNWTNGSYLSGTSLVIQRSTSSTFATTTALTTLTGTLPATYADTTIGSVTGVTTVYYRIQSTDQWGGSAWVTATATLTSPAPAGVTATAGTVGTTTPVTVAWTGSFPAATGFTIQRATNNTFTGPTSFTTTGTPPTNGYSDSITTPTRSTTYYYRVQSTDPWGASAWSNTASVTLAPPAPTAPTGVTATAAAQTTFLDQITVRWTAGTNQSNFRIEYSTSSNFTTGVTTVTTAGTATSQVITGLRKGVRYYVRVQAYNTSSASAYVNATPFPVTTP